MTSSSAGALLRSLPQLRQYRRIIGLCGGVASGKSHARQFLASLGCVAVDADSLAHTAYAAGTRAHDQIIAEFGSAVVNVDGSINRRTLGGIVFGDAARRERLQAIVWPAVHDLVVQHLADAAARETAETPPSAPLIGVVEAALMIEAGWAPGMDELWVTLVPPHVALARMQERDGLSADAAAARLRAQLGNEERQRHAHVVIDTSGTKECTRSLLAAELDRLRLAVGHETAPAAAAAAAAAVPAAAAAAAPVVPPTERVSSA